ncbi:MAG: alpha/beta hydrolase [Deltaproteobacteria bacterium]|nr:alpha/beta hydrolase [Deltaproteobacteria bacterium]
MGDGFFFQPAGDGPRLYGFLHGVPSGVTPRDEGAVLVHPFMEERQDSHQVSRNLGEDLARDGFPALRFDLYGAGDSAGEWHEGTVERWVDDVVGAAAELRRRAGVARVALLGLRFGGTLAALAARRAEASRLVLWQPIVKGEAYAQDLLRAHLSAEMVLHKRAGISREVLVQRLSEGEGVNLFGYQLSPAQYKGLCGIDLTRDLAGFTAPTLAVDVVRTAQARESKDLRALVEALGPSATYARAVETQSLYTEAKVHYTRADQVSEVTRAWLRA